MNSPTSGPVPRHIIVADEDRAVVDFVIKTLREDGHAVFHAYDVLAATQLAFALEPCDLVLSNTRVEGADGVELVVQLRRKRPTLPIIYLANNGQSSLEVERQLPADVPILRLPFTAEQLRATVNAMFNGKR
jgi:DNA-binding response OmpR family regulator